MRIFRCKAAGSNRVERKTIEVGNMPLRIKSSFGTARWLQTIRLHQECVVRKSHPYKLTDEFAGAQWSGIFASSSSGSRAGEEFSRGAIHTAGEHVLPIRSPRQRERAT